MWDLLNLIFCLQPYREVPLSSMGDSWLQCGFIICRNKTPKLKATHSGEEKVTRSMQDLFIFFQSPHPTPPLLASLSNLFQHKQIQKCKER